MNSGKQKEAEKPMQKILNWKRIKRKAGEKNDNQIILFLCMVREKNQER